MDKADIDAIVSVIWSAGLDPDGGPKRSDMFDASWEQGFQDGIEAAANAVRTHLTTQETR